MESPIVTNDIKRSILYEVRERFNDEIKNPLYEKTLGLCKICFDVRTDFLNAKKISFENYLYLASWFIRTLNKYKSDIVKETDFYDANNVKKVDNKPSYWLWHTEDFASRSRAINYLIKKLERN